MATKKSNIRRALRLPLSKRKLAQPVLARAELRDVRLLNCSVKHTLKAAKFSKEVSLSVNGNTSIDEESRHIEIQAIFSLTATAKGDPKQALHMEFAYALLYEVDSLDGLENRHFEEFTRWIALNNAFPYAREFVQSMTMRLGLHPIKLPLFRPEASELFREG